MAQPLFMPIMKASIMTSIPVKKAYYFFIIIFRKILQLGSFKHRMSTALPFKARLFARDTIKSSLKI